LAKVWRRQGLKEKTAAPLGGGLPRESLKILETSQTSSKIREKGDLTRKPSNPNSELEKSLPYIGAIS